MVSVSAAIVADCSADGFRYCVQVSEQLFNALVLQFRRLFQSGVQVRHISVVVSVMVNFHRQSVDVWFKCVVRVRKCR
ncbi:hypothetical protein D3C80_1498310 [compost metagenome]